MSRSSHSTGTHWRNISNSSRQCPLNCLADVYCDRVSEEFSGAAAEPVIIKGGEAAIRDVSLSESQVGLLGIYSVFPKHTQPLSVQIRGFLCFLTSRIAN